MQLFWPTLYLLTITLVTTKVLKIKFCFGLDRIFLVIWPSLLNVNSVFVTFILIMVGVRTGLLHLLNSKPCLHEEKCQC